MNEAIILGMANPYIKNGKLTYDDFDHIYDMLSLKEQYSVVEILHNNSIELVSATANKEEYRDEILTEVFSDEESEYSFKILYDDNLFSAENAEQKLDSDFLIIKDHVAMSNNTLIRLIQEGNQQAKQDLCIKNRNLVYKYAALYQKTAGNHLTFDDLKQAGMIGLLKAASRFDLGRDTQFSTYAVPWIKQSITREIEDNGFTIRIPVHKMQKIFRVCKYDAYYSAITDYYLRIKYIAEACDYSVADVEDCLRLYNLYLRTASLDVTVGEDDTTLGEMVPLEGEDSVEKIVSFRRMCEDIEKALETLSEREQKIIKLRFGLDDGRARTLEEIGVMMGVTRERIRQIESKALEKLRHPVRIRKLKEYLD